MANSRSAALDDIAAATDPIEGLRRVAEYLTAGEEKLREARQLRARFVLQAREQQRTWPVIAEATGGIDQTYLRREMEEARREEASG